MIRNIVFPPLLCLLLLLGVLFISYGEVEPCRALAVERARETANRSSLPVEAVVEPYTRMGTGGKSTLECTGDLFRSWLRRASREFH